MSAEPTIGGTVQSGDFTITSTHETAEQMTQGVSEPEANEPEEQEPDPSKAASILGKKGGEAAAAKRAAEAKEAAKAEKAEKTAKAAESEDEATPDERTDEEKKLGKPRHDPRARMLEATRKEAEAKREAETARREREEARAEAARYRAELERARAGKPEERPQRQATGDEPKEEDYENYTEFLRASVRHEIQQEQRKEAEARRAHARDQHMRGYVGRFAQAMTKAAEADPSFRDRVSPDVVSLQPSLTLPSDGSVMPDGRTWIADELLDNPEHAPALALHLSEHPEDFQRIAALQTPRAVTREMARLVGKLDAPKAPEERVSVSRARPPVRPVTGAPPVAGEPDPDASDFDTHMAYYNGQQRRR